LSSKPFDIFVPVTMVVLQKKNPANSTLNNNSKLEDMSRMQQDLAISLHQTDNPSTSNGACPNMLRRVLSSGRKPHVCVVGAGFAGLRCADVLLQKGMKVTILEARDRVGGRVNFVHSSYSVSDP
jgi:alanine dehydrogenase